MRLSISLLASLGIVGAAVAQTNNEFPRYSGSTNFTTRSALAGTSEGEVCQRYPAAFFNAIGQTDDGSGNTVNRIAGMRYVIQDQSGITQEFFEYAIKGDDALAPGNVDPTNDLVRSAPIGTPVSSATGPVAWIYTSTFGTPYDNLAPQADLWFCIDVPANAAWTADGISVHMSGWTNSPVDNPNLTATIINFVNTVDQTAILNGTNPQAAVGVNNTRNQRIWPITPGATLQLGADIDPAAQVCPNPNYGCAGLYPDQNTGRNDGVSFKVVDANLPNTLFTILGTFGPSTTNPPIPVAGFVPGSPGSIYLNLPFISASFGSGLTDAAGLYETITFPWPFVLSAPVGVMTFQGFGVDFTVGRIVPTNSASFDAQ